VRRYLLSIAIAGALALGAMPALAQDATPEPTPPPEPVGILAQVIDRGQLVCGVNGGLPGFSFLEQETGDWSGLDVDFCRAVAAAVLGDASAVEFRALSTGARGPALQTGEVDLLSRNTTWTVSRDTSWGIFAPTVYYDGQGMMVRGAEGISTLEELDGATICVQQGTTTELNLADQMRARGVSYEPLVFAEIDPAYQAYEEERCDAVTSDRSQLAARRTTFADPSAHVILEVVMSKEPLAPVVPLGDVQWFNVVKWTVFATIEAEELGVTSANVQEMLESEDPVVRRLLGVEGGLGAFLALRDDWVVDVISQVGNYAEIFDRNLGPDTPFALDRGVNALWTDGGLLYAPPYR
jgi:general L-amino acid transport system substrate-binding protein